MATIGIRWEGGDAPPDKDDWERIIQEAIGDTGLAGTVVLRHEGDAWEVEAARVGQLPMGGVPVFPDPTDFQPQVEQALLAAGKPVRARAAVVS